MDQRPGGILPSNVDTVETGETTQRKPGRNFLVPILCLLVAAGLGALVMLLFTSSQTPPPRPAAQPTSAPAAASAPTTVAQPPTAQNQPPGQAQRQPRAVGVPLPINGISCDALESTIFHIHI